MHWTQADIDRAWNDFRAFVYIVWLSIGLPAPTPIQLDIAKALQNAPSNKFVIQGFRGVAKSFLTCAYVVWRLWKNPLLKVMIVSASKDRADSNAVFVKKIINTVEFLDCLRLTDVDRKAGLRDTQNLFDVHGVEPDISPSVKSVGITGQITGSRADILVSDDVEIPNNSGTQVQRDKLFEAVKEYASILKPNGQIIYLGTPQNEMSLYTELQKRGYTTMIWPVLFPTPSELDNYGSNLAPYLRKKLEKTPSLAGEPTDPKRFNMEEINDRLIEYGKAGFMLQFMLNTNLSDAEKYPLKVADMIVTDLDLSEASLSWSWASGPQQRLHDIPCVALKGDYFYREFHRSQETGRYTGTMMYIDPSGRGKDETSFAVTKFLNGYIFLFEVGGYKDGYSDATLRALANKAKFYGVNDVRIEPNFGDGMFTKLILPVFNEIHPCSVEETEYSTKQKEFRIIDTLEPVLMRHRLIVSRQVILDDYKVYEKDSKYSLIYQMTRMSRDKGALAHDDRLEAVKGAVQHWLDVMDRDDKVGLEDLAEEQLMEWMDPARGIFAYRHDESLYAPVGTGKKYNNSLLRINMLNRYIR